MDRFWQMARRQNTPSLCFPKIYATHVFIPTELYSGYGGPLMVKCILKPLARYQEN